MIKRLADFSVASLLACALTTPALAGSPSIAVSAKGANSAGCGAVASPCRTLQYAFSLVDAGGDINIMDSAEYGPLAINKSVNVVYAGTGVALVQPAAAGRHAVIVSAGSSDVVRLRGLTIDGGGVGSSGVYFATGARLEIADSAIHNFAWRGLFLASPNSGFSITNTTVSNNGAYGVVAAPASGAMTGAVDGLRLFTNKPGGMLIGAVNSATNTVVVNNSVAMNHRDGAPGAGFQAFGAGAKLTLNDSTTMDNLVGVQTSGGATIRLAHSNLVGNTVAVVKPGGTVETFGDNIFRNPNDALATLTPVPLN